MANIAQRPAVPEASGASGSAASNLLAALRSGLGFGGADDRAFSDLLTNFKAAAPQRPTPSEHAEKQRQDGTRDSRTITSDQSDDRASLRTLLRRMQQDADALQQSRQDARAAKDAQNKESASDARGVSSSENKAERAPSHDADRRVSKTTKGKDDAPKTAKADEEGESSVTTSTVESFEQDVKVLSAKPLEASEVLDLAPSAASVDVQSIKDILADIARTEQIALMLLNRMTLNQSADVAAQTDEATTGNGSGEALTFASSQTNGVTHEDGTALKDGFLNAQGDADTADGFGFGSRDRSGAGDARLQAFKDAGDKNKSATANGTSGKGANLDFLNLMNDQENIGTSTVVPVAQAWVPSTTIKDRMTVTTETALKVEGVGGAARTEAPSSAATLVEGARASSPYDVASQLSATRAARGGATGLPSAVEQVALQLRKQIKDGDDTITMQLRPAELGRIEIKLHFTDTNKVQGTVVADNQVTLDLLAKDVGSLQRALQDAGLRADTNSLQFSLRGDGQSSFAHNANTGSGGHSSFGPSSSAFDQAEENGIADISGGDLETYYLTPGRVNLRV